MKVSSLLGGLMAAMAMALVDLHPDTRAADDKHAVGTVISRDFRVGKVPKRRPKGGFRTRSPADLEAVAKSRTTQLDRLVARHLVPLSRSRGVPSEGQKIFEKCAPAVCFLVNRTPELSGVGSGSFVGDGTFIITNQHVAGRVGLALEVASFQPEADRPMLNGRAVTTAVDVNNDLALLKVISGPPAPAVLELGKGTDAQRGMKVYAIGHPKGIPWCFSDGAISAILKDYSYRYDDGVERTADALILTYTPIDPGSSGSPLVSPESQLIGVNAMSAPEGQISNLAIRVDVVSRFFRENRNRPVPSEGNQTEPEKRRWVTDRPDVVDVTNVYLSSVADFEESEKSIGRFSLKEFFVFTEFETHEVFGKDENVGFEFEIELFLEVKDSRTQEWVNHPGVQSEARLFPIQWNATKNRAQLSLSGGLPRGEYRIVSFVNVGWYIDAASVSFQVGGE